MYLVIFGITAINDLKKLKFKVANYGKDDFSSMILPKLLHGY